MVRGQLLLLVLVGKDMAVLLLRLLSHLLVLVCDRPLLPVFMGRRLQLVVLQLMFLLLLLLLLLLLHLQLPGLARAKLLLLVLAGTYMELVVGPLVMFMQL
jgi:hypothetical protein